ncbi:hypothetical protein [Methylobacterium ajmalii]|uniref:hypothetical protein n=1 Tax=Methylobacterium ajmalii TaxID=2738439 RepID=UPI00190D3D89|nr:hypothetical protein [Methylobacterium ajmalii]MBK3396320.1 hypothetical protein [Methylobacterium ajmalii]MBK3412213.1 hypothetical protein [Methylobacterium ajmalii]MBK3426353.1 hypothetical protein [Methylobacterium ajmalii]MBZ6415187.1 hypothetical protein [Methylobacterium sp.]
MLKREADLDGNDIYLGETMFEDRRIARLMPRALARPDGWVPVDPAWFPTEGCVFSIDPRVVNRPAGYVVLFTVGPTSAHGGRDRFVTTRVDEPIEVIRSLATVDPATLRRNVMTEGLDRGLQTEPRVVIAIQGRKLACPTLRLDEARRRWTLSHLESAERIELHPDDLGPEDTFAIDGRHYLLPGDLPSKVIAHANWQTDVEFLQYILKVLKKIPDFRSDSEDYKLNDKLTHKLWLLYRDTDMIGDKSGHFDAARGRLGEFLSTLTSSSEAAVRIADQIFADPAVQGRLAALSDGEREALRRDELERIRPAIVAEVDRELADRRAEVEALSGRVLELEDGLSKKSAELAGIEELFGSAMDRVRGNVGSILGEVRETGEAVTRLMDLAGLGRPEVVRDARSVSTSPWLAPQAAAASRVELTELPRIGASQVRKRGLDEAKFRCLDVLCRAGEIPVVYGDSAERLLESYASVISGGRLLRSPLDPTMLGPEDLWRHPGLGSPTPLAVAWGEASEDPIAVRLVCLDDIERAALADWFPRFRTLFRAHRPPNLLVVATSSVPVTRPEAEVLDLDTVVRADGGDAAFAASIMKAGSRSDAMTMLTPPLVTSTVTAEDRSSLLVQLSELEGAGGDLGARLAAIYAAARTWLDHDGAAAFTLGLVSGRTGTKTKGAVTTVAFDTKSDRKISS